MRTLRRRTAIGATTGALLFAAVGTSLAAVRAARDEGGVVGISLGVPPVDRPAEDPGTTLPPTAVNPLTPDVLAPPPAGVVDPSTGPSAAAPGASAGSGATFTSPAPVAGAVIPSAGQAAGATVRQAPRATTPATLAPAAGPTPTTRPVRPSSPSCPTDSGAGSLAHPTGRLRAVDYTLPWPGGPLVLLPQATASRSSGHPVIASTSAGILSSGGSSLVLSAPVVTRYTIAAGSERASGSIAFTQAPIPQGRQLRACRDRRLVIYDVGQATHHGSPLRIVGMVAPPGLVTIGGNGGTAHFRTASPGAFRVTLLTANDEGVGGPMIAVTVVVP